MKIANSSISMASSREFTSGIRVSRRSRISAVQSSGTRNREKSTAFEYSGRSFSQGKRFASYTNDGRKQSLTSGGFNIESHAIKAKLKVIEKEEKIKEETDKLGNKYGGLSLESIKKSLLDDVKEEEAKLLKKIVEAIRKFMEEIQGKKHTVNEKGDEMLTLSEILKKYSIPDKNFTGSTQQTMSINRIETEYEETLSYVEAEVTSFAAEGSVTSADGRQIDFKMEMGMSRAYEEVQGTRRYSEFNFKDPLVLNLEPDAKDITEKKFDFDIDGDGEKDSISFAGRAAVFLLLIKTETER